MGVLPFHLSEWVERLRQQSDRSLAVGEEHVHATHWWILEGDSYLGAIDLRHYLNAFLLYVGGHIGYSIRPSFRRRGLATWALGAVLPEARALDLDRVLVTCDDDNVASARGIERNGGVLEDVRTTNTGIKRRYWITLQAAPSLGGEPWSIAIQRGSVQLSRRAEGDNVRNRCGAIAESDAPFVAGHFRLPVADFLERPGVAVRVSEVGEVREGGVVPTIGVGARRPVAFPFVDR
ncbi:GNAT family N-acetyltransferase [Streptomyces sp. NPDC058086]|uniref:GNAT family N-acetyltransferase n=1 Tax=Streptomyces sp. NPDC058086 TaxID=3346334 RepID=UPI0036E4EE7E